MNRKKRNPVVYSYSDRFGKPSFNVIRKDHSKGKDIFIESIDDKTGQMSNTLNDRFKRIKSRELYRVQDFLRTPFKKFPGCIMIVEGEKCCDSLNDLFGDVVSVTSSGGSSNSDKTDWSPVAHVSRTMNLPILLLPDNDEAGKAYVNKVANLILEEYSKATFRVLRWSEARPKGYDVADLILEELQPLAISRTRKEKKFKRLLGLN